MILPSKIAFTKERAIDVMRLHSEGKSHRQVGKALGIPFYKISYVLSSLRKLNQCGNNAQLILKAYKEGVI